jgi:hypothetical protein
MHPEHNAPSEAAIYWFLKYQQLATGKVYEMRNGSQLARDAGLNRKTVARVLKHPPSWLVVTRGSLDISRDNEPPP